MLTFAERVAFVPLEGLSLAVISTEFGAGIVAESFSALNTESAAGRRGALGPTGPG